MANEKLLMVLMAVTEMAKAKAFYTEQLGWSATKEEGQEEQHWVSLSLPGGGASLTLTTMRGHCSIQSTLFQSPKRRTAATRCRSSPPAYNGRADVYVLPYLIPPL